MLKYFLKSSFLLTLVIIITFISIHGKYLVTTKHDLAQCSWGQGNPSGTMILAIATGHPWWQFMQPPGLRCKHNQLEQIMRIDRSAIYHSKVCTNDGGSYISSACRNGLVMPYRGLGYYGLLGGFTYLRSLFSQQIIIDLPAIIFSQKLLFYISFILAILCFGRCIKDNNKKTFIITAALTTTLYWVFFHQAWFQHAISGIIDSTLATPCGLLMLPALLKIQHLSQKKEVSRQNLILLILIGLFLSFTTLVRGEFLYINFLTLLMMWFFNTNRAKSFLIFLIPVLLLFSFPVIVSLINLKVFGYFNYRIGVGPNLVEPIGQFPNPWGIKYYDNWFRDQLPHGLQYWGFDTDKYYTAYYFSLLKQKPMLFISNFFSRLGIKNFLLITLVLFISYRLRKKDNVFNYIRIPFLYGAAFLIFFAWFNSLARLTYPAFYLFSVFGIYSATYICCQYFNKRSLELSHIANLEQKPRAT